MVIATDGNKGEHRVGGVLEMSVGENTEDVIIYVLMKNKGQVCLCWLFFKNCLEERRHMFPSLQALPPSQHTLLFLPLPSSNKISG